MSEFTDPTNGEIIDKSDVDGLLLAYSRITRIYDQYKMARQECAWAITNLTEGEKGLTRRIRGKRFRAKITIFGTRFDSGELRALWRDFPEYRDEFLKIDTFSVRKREVKKLVNEQGPPELMEFKERLLAAEGPSYATPKIEVEALEE